MRRLIVRHVATSRDSAFVVTNVGSDGDGDPTFVLPPDAFGTPGQNGSLLEEIRWYLEDYLDYPFLPWTTRAARLLDSLRGWGKQAFQSLFGSDSGKALIAAATEEGRDHLCLEVKSDDPRILAWPWEALVFEDDSFVALSCRIERRLSTVTLPNLTPRERLDGPLNVLLVIARPKERDAPYRYVAGPWVEGIQKQGIDVTVTVLRPPTFGRLCEVLAARPGFFDIMHFDGHGEYGVRNGENSTRVGRLVFETAARTPEYIDGSVLSATLRESHVPAVILNACRSGMVDDGAETVFASVAASLLNGGVRTVVAMSHSLYVTAARICMASFYRSLFHSGDFGLAVRNARQEMHRMPYREGPRGVHILQDWIIPVIYQQKSSRLRSKIKSSRPIASNEGRGTAPESPDSYIEGRDDELLWLERALRGDAPVFLVYGLEGIGKTTLVKDFGSWLLHTGGLEHPVVWIDLRNARTEAFVFEQIAQQIFGEGHLLVDERGLMQKSLLRKLRDDAFLIVWDSVETASGAEHDGIPAQLSETARAALKAFARGLRGGKSKLIAIGHREDEWVEVPDHCKLPVHGLLDARWSLTVRILKRVGGSFDPKDQGAVALVNALNGHPGVMGMVLPLLKTKTPGTLLDAVANDIASLELEGGDDLPLADVVRFVEHSIPEELRFLFPALAVQSRCFAMEDLVAITDRAIGDAHGGDISRLLECLRAGGLIVRNGPGTFHLHPALVGILRARTTVETRWTRAFVERMAGLAGHVARLPLTKQRRIISAYTHNLRHARELARTLAMPMLWGDLTMVLGAYALDTAVFEEAEQLLKEGAQNFRDIGNVERESDFVHHLGLLEQRRGNLDLAEAAYRDALALRKESGPKTHRIASSFHQLGCVRQERGDWDGAEEWFRRCEEMALAIAADDLRGSAVHQLGLILESRREFEAAERELTRALEIKRNAGDDLGMSRSYVDLGNIAKQRGMLEPARRHYSNALAIKESLSDERGVAACHHNLGIIAAEVGNVEDAQKRHLSALSIRERHSDRAGASASYAELSALAEMRGDLELAKEWCRKAIANYKTGGDRSDVSFQLRLAVVAQIQGNLPEAAAICSAAMETAERYRDDHSVYLCVHELGNISNQRNEFEAAAALYIRSALGLRSTDEENCARCVGNFHKMLPRIDDVDLRDALRAQWLGSGLPPAP